MGRNEVKGIRGELKTQATILGGFAALMWILEIVDLIVFRGALDRYGVRPRSLVGLRGILFMPFLHGGLGHLIANTPTFLILGWFVMLRETSDFFVVTGITMLVGGLGVWLVGSPYTFHVGASGLIFGYLGYLLLRGYFERRVASIFLSITVGLLYGGLIWGVLPSRPGVSWEGHLFGFIGGAIAARLLAQRRSPQRRR